MGVRACSSNARGTWLPRGRAVVTVLTWAFAARPVRRGLPFGSTVEELGDGVGGCGASGVE